MSRRKAKQFIEAAGSGLPPARAPRDMADLLGAAELLKQSATATEAPDPQFEASLKTNLMARYNELVAGEKAPAKPSRAWSRWTLWAIPAVAAAAALIISLVLVVSTSVGNPTIASLKVYVGKAVVIEASGSRHTVTGSRDIHEKDTVKVDGGSRAAINFKNKNIARLEAGTEVNVADYSAQTVALVEKSGKVYSRVIKGTNYTVQHGAVDVHAVGTAFDVDVAGKGLNAPVFQGTAEVSWPGSGNPFKVEQGTQAAVIFKNGGYDIQVAPFDVASLDFSWLAFNRDLDKNSGFPLGVLEDLGAPPSQGTQPPSTVPGQPAPSTPGGPVPTTPGAPGSTPASPTTPQEQPSAVLSVIEAGPPVNVQWSGTNVSSADTVYLLRATGTGSPAYPRDVIAKFGVNGASSYRDSNVQAPGTYTYSVVYAAGGAVLATSNAATVNLLPPPVSLNVSPSGYPVTGGMQLKWSSDDVADSWVVLRFTSGTPSYPGST
jgi:ferric-dicitrate binding protein FerR (iron transport regulator)